MKMRRFLSALLVLCLVLTLLPATVSAATTASGSCGENVTWTLDSSGTLTISGSGAMKDYPYSASVEYLHPWVNYEEDIKRIVISKGVTYIGNYAFCDSVNVTEISIADTVTSFGESVFMNCTSLTKATIPDSVTEAGSGTFKDCTALKSVTLSKNLSTISIRMFNNCDSLTSFTVPGTVTVIESGAFMECDGLTRITIPESVQTMGEHAFSDCDKLDEVIIPKSVTALGMNVFDNCYGLLNMAFAGDAPSIGGSAFFGNVTNVYYPGGNETWTEDVRQQYGGTIIWIGVEDPENVDFDSTSGSCGENTTWKLENGTLTVSGTGEMEYVPWRAKGKEITKAVIQNGVTTVCSEAFYGCTNLKSVSLPSGLKRIGGIAFAYCEALTSISIPDTVTEFGERAFDGCINLKTANLPSGLTKIPYRLFYDCYKLTNQTIPANVTEIGEGAFEDCEAFTSVTIPAKVEKIGDCAFRFCSSLKTIKFEGSRPDFGGNFIFEGVTATFSYPADQKGWEKTGPHSNCQLTMKPYCSGKHTNTVGEVVQAPTCSTPGTAACVCSVCGKEYTVEITGGDHVYDSGSVTLEATCTADGIMCYTCTLCGVTREEYIPATEHVYDEGAVTTPALCESTGTMTYTCTGCGRTERETIPALGHEYSEPVFISKEKGHSSECSRCGGSNIQSCTFDEGVVLKEATMDEPGVREYGCTVCGGSYQESVIYRISGSGRCETALAAAEELKEILGVASFDTIIIASGENFADALTGSYLAAQEGAPILLFAKGYEDELAAYVEENLTDGGKVYILGGTSSVPQTVADALAGYEVERLAGADRFETNLKILEEAGSAGEEVLVCTANNFADSLSASAVGKPIMLVGKSLNDAQTEYLSGKSVFSIIGGVNSVSEAIETELASFGQVNRISGASREETSVAVAEKYFDAPQYLVLAYSRNFPDGLCGGPLAYALGAPLILTASGTESAAADYAAEQGITKGIILGGPNSIPDATANLVFSVN